MWDTVTWSFGLGSNWTLQMDLISTNVKYFNFGLNITHPYLLPKSRIIISCKGETNCDELMFAWVYSLPQMRHQSLWDTLGPSAADQFFCCASDAVGQTGLKQIRWGQSIWPKGFSAQWHLVGSRQWQNVGCTEYSGIRFSPSAPNFDRQKSSLMDYGSVDVKQVLLTHELSV